MKQTLLSKVMQLRYFAMLLVMLFGMASVASAQTLESDDINEAILVDGSIPVKWTNDPTNPWVLSEDGTYIRVPEVEGEFTSTLSFTSTSQYPVDLNFDWYYYDYYSGETSFKVNIDGIENEENANYGWHTYHVIIPSGEHKIEFIFSTSARSDIYNYVGLRNFKFTEYKELEAGCLKPGSMELKFQNDPEHPWLTEDGYITSMTVDLDGEVSSKISTTINIDTPSLFSFEYQNGYTDYSVITSVYIDGVKYKNLNAYNEWGYESVVLYPGSHTVEFEHYTTHKYGDLNWTQLRNICLDQSWFDVTVSQPGTLSNRIIQAIGENKHLQDVELLKISGSINETDWATIKQLTDIAAIDLTGTTLTSIPDEAFRNLSKLSTVMLPESLKEIGHHSFRGTNFHRVTIPAAVESIGYNVWYETPLQHITFSPNSQLYRIGYGAFARTNLIEFDMPDAVTTPGRYTGYTDVFWDHDWYEDYYDSWDVLAQCYSLKRVHLSEGLTTVPRGVVYECTALEEVNVPKNATEIEWQAFYNTAIKSIDLPETLEKIAYSAFAYSDLETLTLPKTVATFSGYGYDRRTFEYCKNLKTVVLNSHHWDMAYEFNNCTALERVVLPCATPPSIYNNDEYYEPFKGVNKDNITLIVPDFALEAYRTDSYWYQFKNIQAGDEASLNDYWAIRGNLTIDAAHTMQGIPSLEIMNGGVLNMDTDVAQSFNEFTYNTSESNPSSFLSQSNSVTANKLNMDFYIEKANQWFFFSPVCDVLMSEVSYPATDSWVIRYYDGAKRAEANDASGNWVNVPADGTLKRGQGYIFQANTAGWLHLPVAATEHANFFGANEVTLPLEDNPCENTANAGWNFVGNTYPTYYDIYYIDLQAPITVWTGSTYRAYSLNDGDRGDDNYILRPMQPFFVQKDTEGLTTGLPLTGRRTSATVDRTGAPRRTVVDPNRQLLNLELLVNGNSKADDYTRIVLNEDASLKYEIRCDASKFISLDNKVAQIYSIGNDNQAMAINERPYSNGIVALGVYLPVQGATYTIAASRADRQAWIYDAETGMEHDLTAGAYTFTAAKSGYDADRFSIRFAPATSGVDNVAEGKISVTGNNGFITVNAPEGSNVAVYAADGAVIANETVSSAALDINVANGIYVVKVNGETFKTIVK